MRVEVVTQMKSREGRPLSCDHDQQEILESLAQGIAVDISGCPSCCARHYTDYRKATSICETCREPMLNHEVCGACGILCGTAHLFQLTSKNGHDICTGCFKRWQTMTDLLGHEVSWVEFMTQDGITGMGAVWKRQHMAD